MKLLNKENLLLIPVYVVIFTLVGIGFYFTALYIIRENASAKLLGRKEFILSRIQDIESIKKAQYYSFNTLKVEETPSLELVERGITDTVFYDGFEKKYDLYNQLVFNVNQKGKNYKITLRRAIVGSSDWVTSISQVVLLVFFILLVLLFAANVIISQKIWRPFYIILDKLLLFKISEPGPISFPNTSISEFQQLTGALEKMMEKIKGDYISLKKFTENSSHEFQTPLSVIQVKLDMLLQSSNLSQEEVQSVNSALKSVKKLSKLNESLLLLTKIENGQFNNETSIDLSQIIGEKVENLRELIQLKNISLIFHCDDPFYVKIDRILADLLIENLLSNAIKHNIENGIIEAHCSREGIEIKNTGEILSVSPSELFERFSKSNQNAKSLGLGLAIVKEICHSYGLGISYTFKNGYHILSLLPPSNDSGQ